MIRNLLFAIAAVIVILAGLGGYLAMQEPAAADMAMRLPVEPVPLVIETEEGEVSFTIEIADDPHERSAGLMYRETMKDDHGMLFVFPQVRLVGFWMRNTPMPLDLVFIGDDGGIRDILPGEPFSDATISPRSPVRFVLELKRGTAERLGIRNGDRVRHPIIQDLPEGGSSN